MATLSYEMVCGPMFAGKTTHLIQAATKARAAGVPVLILAPAFDDRHPGKKIRSHDGRGIGSVLRVREEAELLRATGSLPIDGDGLILVDEYQFLDVGFSGDFIGALLLGLIEHQGAIHIVFHGLDLDAGMNVWPMTERLRRIPDIRITALSAVCAVCGRPAIYTERHAGEGLVHVGGAESYRAVCADHHPLRVARRAA